ncbi:C2H2 finger domain protein, partial [Metarhizium majus ARSEF 297]
MTRRANSSAPSHGSDASYSPEDDDVEDELFDRNGSDHSESETEATDIDDLSLDDDDGCDDIDVDDQVQFFGGNIHPPEYYRHVVESFNESAYETQDYSDGSLLLLDACEEQWRYCFESLSQSNALPLLYNFFDWLLNQKIGKNGRKKRGTRKSSSLGTYWKVFRLVYERATGNKLDPKLNRHMHKVLRDLAKNHGLSNEKRVNHYITIKDLKKQIKTIISTTKKSFKLGELRILAVLFLLLLAPAGARPTSILRIRFGDIRLVLARDPEGEPHNILIRFTLAFTKTYLGVKDV